MGRSSSRYAIASRKFVFPWPLSPTSATPSGGITSSARSMLRKSRIEIESRVTRDEGPCVTSDAAEIWRTFLEKSFRALAHVAGRLERAEEACLQPDTVFEVRVEA